MKNRTEKIKELKEDIEKLQARLDDYKADFDTDGDDFVAMYNDMLNECSGVDRNIQVGCITLEVNIGELMQEQAPVAYRCGACDYLDSIEQEDLPGYKELANSIEDLENELYELEEETEESTT